MITRTTENAFTTDYEGISPFLYSDVTVCCGDTVHGARATWDTGASVSCISRSLVEKMELEPDGMERIVTPSGSPVVDWYYVDVMLPHHVIVPNVVVCEAELDQQGFDMLIGMDIILRGDFAISNVENSTVFTFRMPSKERADYTKNRSGGNQ